MLLDSQDDAMAARQQLDEGADFVELSKRVSRAPNADGGGELGMLTQGGLSENLDEVIFALQAGEISEPVPGPSGFHIFQVLEVVPAGPPPRDEIEPGVRRHLGRIAARDHAARCVSRLAGEVGVNVIHDRLWFHYQGRYAEEIHAN
jgi:parvulin-like peptidyl-prolyl isomerase